MIAALNKIEETAIVFVQAALRRGQECRTGSQHPGDDDDGAERRCHVLIRCEFDVAIVRETRFRGKKTACQTRVAVVRSYSVSFHTSTRRNNTT